MAGEFGKTANSGLLLVSFNAAHLDKEVQCSLRDNRNQSSLLPQHISQNSCMGSDGKRFLGKKVSVI
jgi:hypothetical protein